MNTHTRHWTEDDIESYVYRIGFDFVTYISSVLETGKSSQVELANNLGVSEGRVSQLLNNPGNLTLKQIVKLARALGHKVSIVAYDDGDPRNEKGPIAASVFTTCWNLAGKPSDMFAVRDVTATTSTRGSAVNVADLIIDLSLPSEQSLSYINSGGIANSMYNIPMQWAFERGASRSERLDS